MIRALVFDFDGLILETEVPCYQAWREIYREYGLELPLRLWRTTIGTVGGFDPLAYLEEQLGRPIDREAITKRQRERHLDLIALRKASPGVAEMIRAAGRAGLLLGVASSSPRGWVAGHLERIGLLSRFNAIKCRDDVARVKPAPDLYLAALAALGIEAAAAVAVEDSPPGVIAAKEAGLFCVAVPSELTRGMDFGRADLILGSLAGIGLEELLSRVAGEAA